ncbi:lysine 2,3-aminomutase [Pelobacter propionicus]|uniref:L-lysine 2,3-aminomutase n=1 Tax=Pelobacter propionicus (strain DSM 2379 / NBRC 103807 / OttBd1) TaxID=338966 RepID=A1AMY4_PELPD|nr:lysine 2,3-aminomutase [Pelobacter propionicus]ABK98704.1 L-lysine 2,3-aminomutase [Pelobacter propionicus DSM 2379]
MSIYTKIQQAIARKIGKSTELSHWKDWRWQLRHAIRDIATFERLLGIKFDAERKRELEETIDKFPLSITPYYLSLIDRTNYAVDPVFRQAFPSPDELQVTSCEHEDPLHEDADSPVPGITHRYPDRVLFQVSNICSMYCRHCTRKRKVGDVDSIPGKDEIMLGLEYIRRTPVVRDVLLSGGDPLMLPDSHLDWILRELRAIPHVQVIRIGSRMPVVLPYRITPGLIRVLSRYHPLWLNTHFNHPREITTSAREALSRLANAGIPLGNQTVLLAGVNDCPMIIKTLMQRLVENRVRPYYLYQCDLSEGLSHFRTPVGKGMEIMESLVGHTSGFAVPTYVIDAPGGGGKIPVMPNYLITLATNKVVLRNYEGVITTYQEPEKYEAVFCDRNCADCRLELNMEGTGEYSAVGIERLLSDFHETISLTPEDNIRMKRRSNGRPD